MKTSLVLLVLLLTGTGLRAAEPARLAYEQEDAVWMANLDGSEPKKISGGQSPELSPEGRRLAFNTVQATGQPAPRKIAIADLASGTITLLKEIPSENCLGPVWSRDGSKLLFTLYVKNEMHLGLVNADGTGFRFLEAPGAKRHDYWAPAWGPDDQSIFGEDMEWLYQLSLEGKVLKKWKVEKLFKRGGMSGDVRMQLSPDQKTLLVDLEMNEESKRKEWDGPLPAIWTLDLATEKTTRLTPKTLYAWDGHWLGAQSFLFSSQAAGEKEASIYRMSLDGKERKLLVKKARLPSAAPLP